MTAADNNDALKQELAAGGDGADQSSTKEKKVETTKPTTAHNPNKVQAPERPAKKHAHLEEPNVFGNNLAEFVQFLKETWQEFRKISWPSREQVIRETWSVIVLCALITGAVLAFDFAIARVVFEPLDKYAKHMGGGVGHSTQTWAPTQPTPGAPVQQPSLPANAPPANSSSAPTAPAAPTTETPVAPTTPTPATPPKP